MSFFGRKLVVFLVIIYITVGCGGGSGSGSGSGDGSGDGSQTKPKYQHMNKDGEVLNVITASPEIVNHELINMEYDYSCGSSALATVLKYTYNEDVTEKSVIEGLMYYGDREQIQENRAFSLWDMKLYLEAIGYNGAGYQIDGSISYNQLHDDNFESLSNTTIIPIQIDEYRHFVVFRAFDSQFVYLGDPDYGNICLSIEDFSEVIHDNIIFIVDNNETTQKKGTNSFERKKYGSDSIKNFYIPQTLIDVINNF